MKLPRIDAAGTLFLDRDGVINHRLKNNYVKSWSEFNFKNDFLSVIPGFSKRFERIIVVTNQQGVGKGLMSIEDLNRIHRNMLKVIETKGGFIDAIYYCPHLESDKCSCRKPKIELARRAKRDFPAVDFSRSVMLGDSLRDMEFGKNLSMLTVLVGPWPQKSPHIDCYYKDLIEFFANIPD